MVRSGIITYIVLMAIVLQGCNYLHLMRPIKSSPEDWTFGGSMERTNVAHDIVEPPLSMMWEYDASAGFSSYAGAVADSLLFVGNLHGEVHVIYLASGKGAGSYNFGSAIVGTPIIENNQLFVALTHVEENLISYNLLNGAIEWKTKVGDIETSPLLIGNRLYVTTLEGTLQCIEKNSGDVLWKYEVPRHDRIIPIHSSPASDGNLIVFGCDDGTLYAVGLIDGTLRWKTSSGGGIFASPSIDQGSVFVGSLDGSMYSYDLNTGKLLWKTPLGAKIYGSQAVASHRLYVGTAGRTIDCLDEGTGAILWSATTNGVINSTPLLSGTVLYVGCLDKTLYAYNAQTGEKIWEYKTEGRIKTMPVIAKDYLFLFAEDRSVLAFKHSDKR